MEEEIDQFVTKLRLEKFNSEQQKGEETLSLIEEIITKEWSSVNQLIDTIKSLGAVLQAKLPWETTPYNMTRRVIKIILDEATSLNPPNEDKLAELKNTILEVLIEHKAEIEQCQELIAIQGESKIHSDEIILTSGFCPFVHGFLLRAAKKRKFHVLVAECAPRYDGRQMAKSISSSGIQTTLIQDCALFSFMSRVNKVIIGCRTVFFNGGIRTFVGAEHLACAAKFYSVPLYVCTPTYQICPEMSEETNDFASPSTIIPNLPKNIPSDVNVAISLFDYVSPENITSFITNNRGIAPIYVYRQVKKLYHSPSEGSILGKIIASKT